MKHSARWWTLALASLTALALFGCAQKKEEAATPAATQQPAAEPAGEATEHGEEAASITPAGTVPGIWAQVEDERGKLKTAIDNGQLKDVHHVAFAIRDLVVALADKANAANPAVGSKLTPLVDQVKASAGKLDELGDAGNLTGTQAEQAKLETVLSQIQGIAVGN